MAVPPVTRVVDGLLPVAGLSGAPKSGKSTLIRELLARHGTGAATAWGATITTDPAPCAEVRNENGENHEQVTGPGLAQARQWA